MKIQNTILLIVLFIFTGCKPSINDPSKRNENWVWWVDKATGKGKWIPVSNQTTVKNGEFTTFYSTGERYSNGRLKNGKSVDTVCYYNYGGAITRYSIYKSDTSFDYYLTNGYYKSTYPNGEIDEVGIVEKNDNGNQWTRYYKNRSVKWKKIGLTAKVGACIITTMGR